MSLICIGLSIGPLEDPREITSPRSQQNERIFREAAWSGKATPIAIDHTFGNI